MRGRLAFLGVTGLLTIGLTAELYVSMRENDADEAVRALNGIAESEEWLFTGTFTDPPAARFASQEPLANPRLFFEPDPQLGYHLISNLRTQPARLLRNGSSVFNVTYSTDRFGWRATPQTADASADVLFFGGSATFGQGVADADTLAARFSAAMGGKIFAHNFGVPGWGAPQTLRLLELGGEKPEVMQRRVTKAFFFLGPDQLKIKAGSGPGEPGAPRYEMRNGAPVADGQNPDPLFFRLCGYSSLCELGRRNWRPRPEQRLSPATLAAIVARIGEIVRDRYHAGLSVIIWDSDDPVMVQAERELKAHHLDTVSASTAILDFSTKAKYEIPNDLDPNSLAYAALGTYLAQRLGR
jgi:hypothetical protein